MKDPRKVAAVIEGLHGPWDAPLMAALDTGPLRSGVLRRRISAGLDYRVFQDIASRLSRRQLISRIDHATGVSYELTDHGRAVLDLLGDIEMWIEAHPDAAAHVPRTALPLVKDENV